MAWNEFYMQTTGDNLNAGSTANDASVFTSTAGNWDGTSVFTPTTGATTSSLVAVNDWASIYPTGNTTTPYVAKVTAVGAGANGTITLSTTLKFGTAPTSNSGSRNCKTGGAWANCLVWNSGSALATGTVTQSTRINMKAGTYAHTTTTISTALAGSATVGLWYRGYKTTIGDQDTNNTPVNGTDIPLITTTTGRVGFGAHVVGSSLAVSGATLNNPVTLCGLACLFYRCYFETTNTGNSHAFFVNGASVTLIGCYLKATATTLDCVSTGSAATTIWGCTIVGGAIGVVASSASLLTIGWIVFDSQGGDAIQITAATFGSVTNCSFYAPTGNGINITAAPTATLLLANNYFENVNQASKSAINNTSGANLDLVRCLANAYYNCTATVTGVTETFTVFDNGTLASAGFVNPGSQNFGMAAIGQSLGFPGTFENTSAYQGYPDVGAVQHQGSGASYIFQVEG